MLYCHVIVVVNAISVVQRRIDRSSHRKFSIKKGVLTNFSKFTGKHLCQSLFFNRLYYRFFLWIFRNLQDHCLLQNTFGGLPLHLEPCQISMIERFCGNSKSWLFSKKKQPQPCTGVFLWNLWSFKEYFFPQYTSSSCFLKQAAVKIC